MDIDAFGGVYRQIMALPRVDTDFVGLAGPRLHDGNPSQADLDEVTEKVIEIEKALAEVPAALASLDALGSDLNFYYDQTAAAEAAASGARTPLAAAEFWYGQATELLADVRAGVEQHLQVLQTQLAVWSAARATIEHDLRWQEYVAERFGADMAAEPRGFKFTLLEAA